MFNKETRFAWKKKKKYHCINQNLNLNTKRHRQTSLWKGFLIIRLFGNLKVIILSTSAKHVIIIVIIWSMAIPYAGRHKLFKRFLKLLRCIFTVAERKQSGAVISFEEWNWRKVQWLCNFARLLIDFLAFMSRTASTFSFPIEKKCWGIINLIIIIV